MKARRVTFYVEPPVEAVDDERIERALQASRLTVPGWPDFGFRAEVSEISPADAPRTGIQEFDDLIEGASALRRVGNVIGAVIVGAVALVIVAGCLWLVRAILEASVR